MSYRLMQARISENDAVCSTRGRLPALRWLRSGVLALIALTGMGSAWADSLAVMTGGGQSGLGGSAGAQPIVVEARNAAGQPIAGRTINWTTGNGFILSAASTVTNASGLANVTFIYGNYGGQSIVATDPVGATSATATATATGIDSLLVVSGSGQTGLVGTVSSQPIVVEIRDAAGNPITGRSIAWTESSGDTIITLSGASSLTDASGRASINFSYVGALSPPGPSVAIIKANDAVSGQADSTAVSAVGIDLIIRITPANQTGLVGTAGQTVTVEVRNSLGNPIVGRTINWTNFSGPPVALSATSSVTDAVGRASIGFTYLSAGSGQLTATDSVTGFGEDASYTGVGSDVMHPISGFSQAGPVGTAGQPIVVEVDNAAGNPVAGRTINWTSSGFVLTAPSSITDAAGRASVGFTFGSGGNSITATDSVTGQFQSGSFNGGGSIAEVLLLVSGYNQSGQINTAGAQPLVIGVRDGSGLPVVGRTINWTVNFGGAMPSAASSVTDAAGNASINFTYGPTAEVSLIQGSDAAIPDNIGFTLTSTGSDSFTQVSGNYQTGPVNSAGGQPLVVQVLDAAGQPVVGRTINWTVNPGNVVLSAASSATDAAGRASVAFTYGPSAGVSGAQARDPTVAGHVGFLITSTGGDSLTQISGNGQTGVINSVGAQPLVVEVRDAAGQPVAGRSINWSGAGGATPNAVSSLTDAAGRASVSFTYGTTAVPDALGAVDLVSGLSTVFSVTSTAPPETLSVFAGGGQSGPPGTAGSQPIVVVLRDAGGAPIVGRGITWSVASGGATVVSSTATTDASGQANTTFNYGAAAGASILSAQESGGMIAQATVTALAAGPTLTIASGNGQSAQVNASFAQPLVVNAQTGGIAAVGISINWSVVSGAATVSSGTTVTDASGNTSITLTAGASAGAVTITATRQDAPTVTVAFNESVAAAPVLSLALTSGNGQAAIVGAIFLQPLVVTASNNGVPIAGVTINWAVSSGPGTLSAGSAITDASGNASVTLTAGAASGSVVVTATRADNPAATVSFNETVTPGTGTLSIISGNNQSLATNTPSAPLVVELKDYAGTPVPGATISWTATNGTLAAATSVTDAGGRASNTVRVTKSGSASVDASSAAPAASPVTFSVQAGLVNLPGITPEEHLVAVAIDNLCPALASQSSLTPAEADLLARCQDITNAAGIDTSDTRNALEQLLNKTALAQSNATVIAATAQFQNVTARIAALRSGSKTTSLGGLSLSGPGGAIPLASLMATLMGDDDATKVSTNFSRWGFFASGTIGRGEAKTGSVTPAYDYDINGLTFGVDYRQRDNWILGAALGYTRQDTDLANDRGDVAMTGWSASAYSTYSMGDRWYLDGVVTWGRNQFRLNRRINYSLPLPGGGSVSVDQTAKGHPDGDLLESAFTFGSDFHKDAWVFGPYGRLLYTRLGFDSYQETLSAGVGSGLGLAVDERRVNALTGVIGARLTYAYSADWGVLVPTGSLEWEHQFKDDLQSISARFINDPTQTPVTISGDRMDTDYFRVGVGLSMVLMHGRSGFLLYERMVGRDGITQDNFSLGLRIEL